MIRRESVDISNEYPMRPASYIRTAPTVYPSSSPAGTWFAGNAQASFCGFHGQCLIVCSRQTPHVPGKRDNSWSTRALPECRAPSYSQITVAAPDARAQTILRIVRQLQRFFHRFEGGYRQHRAKNLLLEHAHIVLTKQNRRFEVVRRSSVRLPAAYVRPPVSTSAPSFLPISM